jgi:hypothetical protein
LDGGENDTDIDSLIKTSKFEGTDRTPTSLSKNSINPGDYCLKLNSKSNASTQKDQHPESYQLDPQFSRKGNIAQSNSIRTTTLHSTGNIPATGEASNFSSRRGLIPTKPSYSYSIVSQNESQKKESGIHKRESGSHKNNKQEIGIENEKEENESLPGSPISKLLTLPNMKLRDSPSISWKEFQLIRPDLVPHVIQDYPESTPKKRDMDVKNWLMERNEWKIPTFVTADIHSSALTENPDIWIHYQLVADKFTLAFSYLHPSTDEPRTHSKPETLGDDFGFLDGRPYQKIYMLATNRSHVYWIPIGAVIPFTIRKTIGKEWNPAGFPASFEISGLLEPVRRGRKRKEKEKE